MKIDLHIHTTFSDGLFSPEKVVDTAIALNIDVISITDHDNILSFDIANRHLKKLKEENSDINLQLIQGVEINTIYKDYEVHILGYFMDTANSEFKQLIKTQQNARIKQTKEIIQLLASKEGIYIKFEDIN